MRFSASTDIDRLDAENANRFIAKAFDQVASILNNGLTFSDNSDAKILTVVFSTANVDLGSPHGLGRQPSGYIVIGSSAASSIYDGASPNTTSILYLRASVATTAKVLVF